VTVTLRIFSSCVLIAICISSGSAFAYNYHLDRDINNLLSEGTTLTQKYQTAEKAQHDLMQEKQAIDQENRDINTKQTAYNQAAVEHEQHVAKQNQAIQEMSERCNNSDSDQNTTGHVNWCDNRARALNAQSQVINSDAAEISAQKTAITAQTESFNQKAAKWNRHQMLTVSVFNDASHRLNAWLDRTYTFMNTSDFQGNIAWAHAGKRCADYSSRQDIPPEQALLDQAQHALGCLRYVEDARKVYYKKTS
jgi:hypothetical protein